MKKIILILAVVSVCQITFAQHDQRKEVIQLLEELSARYKQPGSISFDMMYRYAAQSSPLKYLDSLSGTFKLSGEKYWYRIDNTESIGNRDMAVMLFKEDNIMYLVHASGNSKVLNPIGDIDSMFLHGKIAGCSVERSERTTKIILQFPAGKGPRQIEYDIDAKTGLLAKTITRTDARQLYDPTVADKVPYGSEVFVETIFRNYRENKEDLKLFDLNQYFKKENGAFVTQPSYQSYKIFLGSSNL